MDLKTTIKLMMKYKEDSKKIENIWRFYIKLSKT